MITKQRQSILDQDPTVTGFNVGINVGASAGQTVFHVHVHLIPKSGGACHNSLEIGISNADPCYTAAVWERVDTLLAKQRAASVSTTKLNRPKRNQYLSSPKAQSLLI